MKKIRIALGSILLLFLIFLAVYGEDNYYLKLRSADKTWSEIQLVLNEVVRKGDYVEYEGRPNLYEQRFFQHVNALNQLNAPMVMNTYVLNTKFSELDGNEIVEFIITEKSTGQIIEQNVIQSEPIMARSIIPGIIALFGALITMRPILCLLAGIWVGASMHAGNSFIMGLHDLVFNYLPYGLNGNSHLGLKICIFLFCIMLVIRLITRTGGLKTISDDRSKLRPLPLVLSLFHPYTFISLGAWWFNAMKKDKPLPNTGFLFQAMGLAIQPFIIASPFLIPVYRAAGLDTRFASIALIAVCACYIMWGSRSTIKIEEAEPKSGLKELRSIPYYSAIAAVIPLSLILVGFNSSSIIMLSGLTSLLFAIFFTTKNKALSSIEILKLSASTGVYLIKYIIYVALAVALGKVFYDLGAIHFMISIFSVDVNSPQFYIMLFLSSMISSSLMGGFSISAPLLISSFIPLMSFSSPDVSSAIICIMEGAIIGELLSPYSPTTIISCAMYGTEPAKYVLRQLPYSALAALAAALLGFLAYGLDLPWIFSYLGIVILTPLSIFLFKKYKRA